jgi:hypothetical protein
LVIFNNQLYQIIKYKYNIKNEGKKKSNNYLQINQEKTIRNKLNHLNKNSKNYNKKMKNYKYKINKYNKN